LRFGLLAAGISYGFSRKQSLTSFVHMRKEEEKQQRYEELVEEAKIAFDTYEMQKMAVEAKKDGGNRSSSSQNR
jgi:Holliday junction resolvasome RuvABC endonuclease subunit